MSNELKDLVIVGMGGWGGGARSLLCLFGKRDSFFCRALVRKSPIFLGSFAKEPYLCRALLRKWSRHDMHITYAWHMHHVCTWHAHHVCMAHASFMHVTWFIYACHWFMYACYMHHICTWHADHICVLHASYMHDTCIIYIHGTCRS